MSRASPHIYIRITMNLSTINRLLKRYPTKWIAFAVFLWLILLFKYCGFFTYFFTRDYFSEFTYPLEGDIPKCVSQLRSGQNPDIKPLTTANYSFIRFNKTKCLDSSMTKKKKINLLILVKSALHHRGNRGAIRRSWGQETAIANVEIRILFLLGISASHNDHKFDDLITNEHEKYGDILQSDFVDAYFNNTIKTMQGIRWVIENCDNAEFILFSDDDMYVSIKNLLKFIRNPFYYPKEIEDSSKLNVVPKALYAGSVFLVSPVRTQFSKWYISVDEYPFSHYPPFVNAGSFVLSYEALVQLFYGSMFTKYFRFDDVFLGLIAKKMKIDPIHSDYFYNWKKAYSKIGYKDIIAVHGYDNPISLTRIWNEQDNKRNKLHFEVFNFQEYLCTKED
uniref:Hexosyltransferase n=1 Tax=Strigamia maritima TaxID=126957 RepID=T1JDR6_STRMM